MHLFADHVIAFEQAWQEFAQGTVAQALIERTLAGIEDGVAGAWLQRVGQGRGELTEFA
ncbi:hypothetical protein D3C78_1001250 [compost metagenome]